MDRSCCRLSKEEYLKLEICAGYCSASSMALHYDRYISGGFDVLSEFVNVYDRGIRKNTYNEFVMALEQAEKVKLLQEALDV